jgi:phospholipid transport system substrate-binding protein
MIAPAVARTDTLQAETPTQVVEVLHEALLEVMKNALELGYEGRNAKLTPTLKEVLDIPFMAEKSVGRHWKTAGEEERARLLETFTRFTIANYAGRFEGYSGERFETLRQEPSLRGTVLVHSRVVKENADPVQLNYRLRQVDGSWKVIDIYLNGTVSEIALRRSEYSSLIRREGFDGLLVALDEKIAELASIPADQS